MISGFIKSDLGGFWFLFFSFYQYSFPRLGTKTKPPESSKEKKNRSQGFYRLEIPRRSRTIPPLAIRLLHSSRLYAEKELRATKLCKHLLAFNGHNLGAQFSGSLKDLPTVWLTRVVNKASFDGPRSKRFQSLAALNSFYRL